MNTYELKRMRKKQLVTVNLIVIIMLSLFILLDSLTFINFSHLTLTLGIFLLIHSIIGLTKIDSTKSYLPIFEKVNQYEKKKLGKEWVKNKRLGLILNLFVSAIIFANFMQMQGFSDRLSTMPPLFYLIFAIFIFLLLNFLSLQQYKKIDQSTEAEAKLNTSKAITFSIITGVLFATFAVFFTIIYLLKGGIN